MAELADLQARVSAALADAKRDGDAASLVANANAEQRFAIYRNNVTSNAAGALAAIYPIVRKIVGAEFFGALARAYCERHPSVSGDLNEIGAELGPFLLSFEPTRSLPYLPDVAALEWLAHKAHYAADHAPLDVSRLASFADDDYSRLKLAAHPAAAVLSSDYPLFRIWEVHQEDYAGEVDIDLGSGGDEVIVYRPEFRAAVAKLSAAEAAFLKSVTRGEFLSRALEEALAADAAFDFAAGLKKWAASNVVVEIFVDHTK